LKIALGADHLGSGCALALWNWLSNWRLNGRPRYEFWNLGVLTDRAIVDYVPIAKDVATKVASGEVDFGILLCGSGQGMVIAANKTRGVRAVLCHDPYSASMSRRHNDANVLCMGGRLISPEDAVRIVEVWLSESFEGGKHQERLDGIKEIENDNQVQA